MNPESAPDLIFDVEGMMCQKNCATTVAKAIKSLTNIVKDAKVTFATGEAEVWLQNNKLGSNPSIIITAIENVGYDARVKSDNRNIFAEGLEMTDLDKNQHNSTTQQISKSDYPDVSKSSPDIVINVKELHKRSDLDALKEVILAVEGVFTAEIDISQGQFLIWGYAERSTIILVLAKKGCLVEGDFDAVTTAQLSNGKKKCSITLNMGKVKGIDSVTSFLESLPGVEVEIDLDQHISIRFYEDVLSEEDLRKTLRENKLDSFIVRDQDSASASSVREFKYSIRGMSCGACAVKIEKTLSKMTGVTEASVSVMTHQGRAVVDDSLPGACGPRDLMDKVKELGYDCDLISDDSQSGSREGVSSHYEVELAQWYRLLIVSLVFGVPVLALHMLSHYNEMLMMFLMEPAMCGDGVQRGQLIMLLLNTPLLVIVGYKYYKAAMISAYHGMLGMDFLVTTGTLITFVYSAVKIVFACRSGISTEHIFFETTGMLLMFVTIGKYIEAYAKDKSATSIAELLKLQPQEAYLVADPSAQRIRDAADSDPIIHDEDCSLISINLLQKGDIIKVLPGGRIPTDGVVVVGTSHVDESTITGESNPVRKSRGDELFGSTVNQDYCLYMSVTSYGADSTLAQIVRLVESAQMNKAPIQEFADRIAGIFTPIILALALCTFLVWLGLSESKIVPRSWFADEYNDPVLFALLFAISVVVISCPCALGLATPTAIMVGSTVGASNGILIKGGTAFEIAHRVDTIVFDKTGTLTMGKPSVTDEIVVNDSSKLGKDALLVLAATAEQRSEHPIALAVLRAAKEKRIAPLPLSPDAAVNFVGSGVSCESGLGFILVGNRGFMKEKDVSISAAADSIMWNLEIQGKTAICVAVDQEVYGILGVSDVAKPEAENALRTLRAMGLDVWMLTGDNATTAEALAHQLEISQDRVMAGMLPQDKAKKVKELQAAGHVIAMVGDGVNDSPALAQADLGVAIGAGTQIAIEAASMVLIRSNLHDLVVAFDLANVVFRRIRWNFMWALVYNVVAVPFAAGVWFPWTHMLLPPHYAAFSMALSSISVVISSMLLKLYRRPPLIENDRAETANLCATANPINLSINRTAQQLWSNSSSLTGYDQLPRDEREWEKNLGIDLGLGSAPAEKRRNRAAEWEDIDEAI